MTRQQAARLNFFVSRLYGRDPRQHLRALQHSETMSPDELRELQWSRLHDLIHSAVIGTRYYADLFAQLNLVPDDIIRSRDLSAIPPLEKDEIRTGFDLLANRTYAGRTVTYGNSGTTGEPVQLHQATRAIASYFAAKLRGHGWHGLEPGTCEGTVWGAPLLSIRAKIRDRIKSRFLNRVKLSAFNASKESALAAYERMVRHGARYLYGYASAVHVFTRTLADNGADPRRLAPRVAIVTSDMLLDDQRDFMESFWGCRVVKEYGAGEAGIIAFECEQSGLHITQENVFVETDETNDILVTPLLNHAMPLLRFRLGDKITLKRGTCSCGRGLALIGELHGRSNDTIVTEDGRTIHAQALCYMNQTLSGQGKGVAAFQLIQNGPTDCCLLVIPGESGETEAFRNAVRDLLGGDARVDLEKVDAIPRSPTGKIRYVVAAESAKGNPGSE